MDVKVHSVDSIAAKMMLQRVLRMIGYHQVPLCVREKGIVAGAVDSFHRLIGKNRRTPFLPYGNFQQIILCIRGQQAQRIGVAVRRTA